MIHHYWIYISDYYRHYFWHYFIQ